MILLRIAIFLMGLLLAAYTFISATRTFVLPRSASVKLTHLVFLSVRHLFKLIMKALPTYEQRDGLMAIYAPISLLLMVPTWLFITTIGFACMFWALGITPWREENGNQSDQQLVGEKCETETERGNAEKKLDQITAKSSKQMGE
jgi:hypothetical protein